MPTRLNAQARITHDGHSRTQNAMANSASSFAAPTRAMSLCSEIDFTSSHFA